MKQVENHGDDCPRTPVRLTTKEREELTAAAAEIGLTLSAYLRMAAIERARGTVRKQ